MLSVTRKRVILVLLSVGLPLLLSGCRTATLADGTAGASEVVQFAREVSVSPDGKKKLMQSEDNELVLVDGKDTKIIYRRYEKEDELLNHPYSLWSFDFFRVQWSADSRYVYIIDGIYDIEEERFTALKDCLIFSWVGTKGVYLTKGVLYEGKFWDHGFYGLYVSKQVNVFEDGVIKAAKILEDDRYFVVMEEDWDDAGKSLFETKGNTVAIRAAKLRYEENELSERILKAYQTIREDEKAWAVLEAEYKDAAAVHKAMSKFAELKEKYPLKLNEGPVSSGHISWDFDMRFYLQDAVTEYIQ